MTHDLKPGSSLSALFHKAWGQAKGSPDYDKQVWKDLEKALLGTGKPAPTVAATPRPGSNMSPRDEWSRDRRRGTLDD